MDQDTLAGIKSRRGTSSSGPNAPLPDVPSEQGQRGDGVPLSFSNQALNQAASRPAMPLPALPEKPKSAALPTGALRRVEALFDCEADQEDELSFSEGEFIIVTEENDVDWWFGYIENNPERYGVFPVIYVKVT